MHWNPRRRLVRRIDNFGDLLGPLIVGELLARAGLDPRRAAGPARLLTVGSVLRLARDGDTVWGTGANGKSLAAEHPYTRLDVRAVRGPRTRAFLADRAIDAPAVYGDPGLLVGHLWERDELAGDTPRRAVTVVPNLHDLAATPPGDEVCDPRSPLRTVLARIAASDLVVGSSLHGIVVAEGLGIPARLVRSATEPTFKYLDHYEGTGRPTHTPAATVAEAVALGGEPLPAWDPRPLLEAFPRDLWRPR